MMAAVEFQGEGMELPSNLFAFKGMCPETFLIICKIIQSRAFQAKKYVNAFPFFGLRKFWA